MQAATADGAAAIETSLWRATNPPPAPAVPLAGRVVTDVLIVGAGISGLSLAWHLAAEGIETVVLEAEAGAFGATVASAGIVAPQLVRTTPNAVLKHLGADTGGRLLRLIGESGRYTFGLIEQLGIECAVFRNGFLNPVSGRQGAASHARLIEEWRPYRQDLELIDAAKTQALSGCRGYSAALLDPTGGGLDPIAYSRGLADAIRARGAPIHHGSRVLSLRRVDGRWRAQTQTAEVDARRVVLCANGGSTALHPSLVHTILPLPVYEVATRPLPRALREKILPQGHTLTDSATDVFSIRYDRDGRLITAWPGGRKVEPGQLGRLVNVRLAALIPDYRSTPLEYIWQGTAWLNSSLLPRVLHVDRELLAVQACNGRGIAMNTIIGRELGRWLADPAARPLVPVESPRRVPGFALARYLPELMMGGAILAKRVLERFGRRG